MERGGVVNEEAGKGERNARWEARRRGRRQARGSDGQGGMGSKGEVEAMQSERREHTEREMCEGGGRKKGWKTGKELLRT